MMMGFPLHEQMHCHHRNGVIGTELIKKMVGKRRVVITLIHRIKTLIFPFLRQKPIGAPKYPTLFYHHMIIGQKASHCYDNGANLG